MTAIKRTCATCVAFNPKHADDEPICGNLVHITISGIDGHTTYRAPYPAFRCDSHQTHAEEHAQDAAVAQFFGRIGINASDNRVGD